MIANYHTHTPRCNHASGSEEEYVRHALKRGLKILGFSDHTPQFFDGNYYSTFRMRRGQLSDYVEAVDRVRRNFSQQIEIRTGVEAEYYPKHFSELLPFLRDNGVEYMILGQHFTGEEPYGFYSGKPTADPQILAMYCRQVMDAMQTGLFTYFAHPDLIRFEGDPKIYHESIAEVFRMAKNCSIPLEINLLGVLEQRHYPSERMLEIAAEENCPMILGCDAHTPDALSDTVPEEIGKNLADRFGLAILDTVELRRI